MALTTLNDLREVHDQIVALQERKRRMVLSLRLQRATWEEIGDALGLSRASAWQMFHKYVDDEMRKLAS